MYRMIWIACWSLLGVLLIGMLGCGQEAVRDAEPIDPRAAQLVQQMQTAYAQGNWHTALALADSAAHLAPNLAQIPFTRGLIFTKLRRYEDARAAYQQTLDLDPSFRQAWYQLGHNSFLQRNYREALSFYKKEKALIAEADRRGPDQYDEQDRRGLPAIAVQIGRTYDLLGVQDSARMAYEEALGIDSTYAVAHAWLSEQYEKQGQLAAALRHAEHALETRPQDIEYAYRVGLLLFQTGQIEDAVPYLTAVVQQWPGHEGATYNLGRALKALGHEDEGQALLDRTEEIQRLKEEALLAQRNVEMHPNDPQRWLRLAGLMLRSGYFDKAEEAFAAALALQPGDLSVQNDLANLALLRGDTTLALQRFQALLRQDSTLADAWLNLGIIYAMGDQPQKARTAWQKVLQYKPEDPDAQAYLSRLE